MTDWEHSQGGNNVPITITPGTLINSLLYNKTPAHSVKANPTGGLTTPTDLVIGAPCQVVGRGGSSADLASVTLSGLGDVKIFGTGNTISISAIPALPLIGGTMYGNVALDTNKYITNTYVPNQGDLSNQYQLINKQYADTLPSVTQANIVYNFIKKLLS